MDYPCAKLGDFSFSRFGFIVLTNRQADRHIHTESSKLLNVGVSNKAFV